MLRSHGSKISGSQQTVVLQKLWKKIDMHDFPEHNSRGEFMQCPYVSSFVGKKKSTCMIFLSIIPEENSCSAHTFLPLLDNAMSISVKKYFCYQGDVCFQTEIYQGEASAMQTVTQAWF